MTDELKAQPVSGGVPPAPLELLQARISEYLALGGCFNPEMMAPQGEVSRLIVDCRDALEAAARQIARFENAQCVRCGRDLDDGGVAETERRHSLACRDDERTRTREAEILQAGYESGKAEAAQQIRTLQEVLIHEIERGDLARRERDTATADLRTRTEERDTLQAKLNERIL